MPHASLVIPTRNRAPALARTLAALTAQTEPRFEVIIADDGSDDDTAAVVRAWAPRLDLRYLRRGHRGIAAARAAAMRAAQADVLIQTDDDRLPAPAFVAEHVAAHADPAAPRVVAGTTRGVLAHWSAAAGLPAAAVATVVARDPALAARLAAPDVELATPAMLADDLPGTLARIVVDEPWWVATAAPLIARYGADLAGFAFPWIVAIGGNTSVPRALAERIGFLDEDFVGWGLEDTDFHFRLCQAGATVHALAGGLSYHQLHARGPDLGRQWTRNAHRLIHKHASLALSTYVTAVRRGQPLAEASDLVAALALAPPAARAEVLRCHRELLAAALG
ncbi:MAG: glycosyltransferase [Kofleriaceae bacterium]